jgi:hypothetical protein
LKFFFISFFSFFQLGFNILSFPVNQLYRDRSRRLYFEPVH